MSWVRRVADGLRTRSAGALLLELMVLVVGILLALGVDGWLERRREAAVAAQSLELVRNDLAQLVEQARELEAYNRGVLEAVAVVWSATGAPGPIEKEPATFDALSALSARRTVRFPKAAYEELVATGNLRLLANPDLRATLVRFYEELERDEEIILRNNEAYTDGLLNGLMVGEGLVVGVPTGRSDDRVEALSPREEIRSAYIPVGVTWEGRLWGLPPGHPDRVRLRAAVAGLSSAAATHLILARRAREGASALIDRIDQVAEGGAAGKPMRAPR